MKHSQWADHPNSRTTSTPWWLSKPLLEPLTCSSVSGTSKKTCTVGAAFAAGIPRQVRVVYFYDPTYPWSDNVTTVVAIEEDVEYTAFFWDPRTGAEHELGVVAPNAGGCWQVPVQPTLDDWVLVLEAAGGTLSR